MSLSVTAHNMYTIEPNKNRILKSKNVNILQNLQTSNHTLNIKQPSQ